VRILNRILVMLVVVLMVLGFVVYGALKPPPSLRPGMRDFALSGVLLINPGMERRPVAQIQVEGEKIAAIEDSQAPLDGGPYLLPGLVDMHVHFPPDTGLGQTQLFAFLFLYHGVTSVRDAGDLDGTATRPAQEGIRNGDFPGPRVFACGPFVGGSDPLWSNSIVVSRPDQARTAVDEIADAGFDCVKAYEGLSPESLAALHQASRERGLPLIGHVAVGVPFQESNLDDVQHFTGVPALPPDETRAFPALAVEWRRVDAARMDFIVGKSRQLEMAHTPTLVQSERLIQTERWAELRDSAEAQLLPRFYRDVIWSPEEGIPVLRALSPEDYQNLRVLHRGKLELVKRLAAAGVRLFAGSDVQNPFVVPGESLHRELELFVEAGLTPEQAWASATRVAGEFLAPDLPGLGRLLEGAPADFLVFGQDPTRDLAALSSLEAVVAQGRLYTREELDAQLARYREHAQAPVFDALSTMAVRRVMARMFEK
jgi:cytosine/adenosine deaminase-related metal-dependent hydrolase